MADYGIKVSRAGFDVKNCADHQLLYSSSFPGLNVAYSGLLSAGQTFTHSLGYEPVFIAQRYGNISGSAGDRGFSTQQPNVGIDTTKIYNDEGSETIYYYIFYRALRTSYVASNINTTAATQTTVSQDYGFKVSASGKDVKTAGLNDLVSFSGLSLAGQAVRQAIIHQQGYEDNISTTATKTYNHDLGYRPLYFSYKRKNGESKYYPFYISYNVNVGPPINITISYSTNISSSSLVLTKSSYADTTDFAYVLFKDQF